MIKTSLVFILCIIGIFLLAGNAHAIIVTDSLVSWWRLEETEGTDAEDYWGSNEGTLVGFGGSPTWTSDTAGIGSSGALEFDGTDDYVDCGNDASLNFERTDSFSLSAWVKPATFSKYQNIVAKKDEPNSRGYRLIISSSGAQSPYQSTLAFVLAHEEAGDGSDIVGYAPNNALSSYLDEWVHVCLTYTGTSDISGVSLYINGQNQAITTVRNNLTGTMQTETSFKMARIDSVYPFFEGLMDEIMVYSKALSPQEVLQNYQAMEEEWVIPEPSALLLLGVGLSGLFVFKRKF